MSIMVLRLIQLYIVLQFFFIYPSLSNRKYVLTVFLVGIALSVICQIAIGIRVKRGAIITTRQARTVDIVGVAAFVLYGVFRFLI